MVYELRENIIKKKNIKQKHIARSKMTEKNNDNQERNSETYLSYGWMK